MRIEIGKYNCYSNMWTWFLFKRWFYLNTFLLTKKLIIFHGASEFKSRIVFKKSGDISQEDSFCSNEYTFTFNFQHQKPLESYIDQGLSPLHTWIIFMFDQFKNKHHSMFMNNVYVSASFARAALQSQETRWKSMVSGCDRSESRIACQANRLKNEKMM